MALFDPRRHEPLRDLSWSAATATQVITEIGTEAQQSFSAATLYPAHPQEELQIPDGGSGYYIGAGGVLWALDYLGRRGYLPRHKTWLIDALVPLLDRIGTEFPDFPMRNEVSYLFGDLPLLMHLFALTGDQQWHDQLLTRFQNSVADPVREMMWGTPGVLIAANLIDDEDLRNSLTAIDQVNIDKLINAWQHDHDGMPVWREELYGSHRLFAGPVHGYAGQVLPLLQRLDALSPDLQASVLARSKHYLQETAIQQSGLCNWPAMLDVENDAPTHLVQYCHGAPGMVISYCSYPADTEVDELLIQGGELIWQAGPLAKGSNLCHGTAGNGFAFLSLYQRTGNPLWLDRARAFAMHAISQYQLERARVGHQRFCLWTGDPGLAIYLANCIDGQAQFPTIDVF